MNHISFCQSWSAQSRSLGPWLVWLHVNIPGRTGPKSFRQVFLIGKTKMNIFDWSWFEVKWGASSRWLPLYCSMRNSDQTTIEKTHATLLTLRPQKWQKSPISFCLAGEFLFRDSMDMRTICLFLYLLIWHKQSTVTVKSLYNLLTTDSYYFRKHRPVHGLFRKCLGQPLTSGLGRTSRSPPSSSLKVSKISNIDILGRPRPQLGPR